MRNTIPSKMRGLCSRRYMFYIYYHILIIIIMSLKYAPLKLRTYVLLTQLPYYEGENTMTPHAKMRNAKKVGQNAVFA